MHYTSDGHATACRDKPDPPTFNVTANVILFSGGVNI